MQRFVVGVLASAALLAACAQPAARSAAPAPAVQPGAPAPAAAPVAGTTPDDAAAYRQQVVEGARREGQANILLSSIWSDDTLRMLEDAIDREYGERIKLNRTPSTNYGQHSALLISE